MVISVASRSSSRSLSTRKGGDSSMLPVRSAAPHRWSGRWAREGHAAPGHWEGDLILGENSRSAVGTLVERSTRRTLLLHLPDGKSAEQVATAMRVAITRCRRRWRARSRGTRAPRWPSTPGSPPPRGSRSTSVPRTRPGSVAANETTNGLLRQCLPKSSDLSIVTHAELTAIPDSLNGRPRKTLGYLTPSEKFAELVATTG